jgi:hypothetical protein
MHTGVYCRPIRRTAPTRNLIRLSGEKPSRLLEYGIQYDLLHIFLNRGHAAGGPVRSRRHWSRYIAVRFKSLQSLEIRDERGLLVFGSHSSPQAILSLERSSLRFFFSALPSLLFCCLSYCFIFQARMGQAEEDIKPDWLPVQKSYLPT